MGKDVIKFTKKLGENVARLRREKELTQEQLSERMGIVKQNISRLERGGVNPTAYFIFKLSKALEVPVEEITNQEVKRSI
jgi:transcriptional regulator with XRE-family HTH domain